MNSPKAARIHITILIAVMLMNLVLARPCHYSLTKAADGSLEISADGDLAENIKRAREETCLTISGGKKECTLKEIGNVVRIISNLRGFPSMRCITVKNLDMAYNRSIVDSRDYINDDIGNDNEIVKITEPTPTTVRSANPDGPNINEVTRLRNLYQVPSYINLLRFIDVSPWAMLILFRRIKFSNIVVFEIQTTCNDISGPLAAFQCNDISSLEIKNSSSTKKYSDLKDNSRYGAKSKWTISSLDISGKDKMKIPAWLFRRVKYIASLSLRHFFFLREDLIEELVTKDIYIKNADEMQKEELEALISKRQIRVIGRNTMREIISVEFNLQKNQNGEIVFNGEYIVFVTKYFAILYSDVKNLDVSFNVETENDIAIRNRIYRCFMKKNSFEKENLEIILNNKVIAQRIRSINRTSQEQQEKVEL